VTSPWVAQTVCIMITPCADGRIMLEISSIEEGLDRRLYFTAQEWADFTLVGERALQAAQKAQT
jgi:hypothetical protein